MMEEKDILCPDCGIKYVSDRLFKKNGKCTSCLQRERAAYIHNKKYIKFIDLPKDERDKILKVRQYVSAKQKNKVMSAKRNKHKKKKSFSISRPDVIEQIRELSGKNVTIREVYEKLCSIYPNENISITNLRNIFNRNGFLYKKGYLYKKSSNSNDSNIETKNVENVLNINNDLDKNDLNNYMDNEQNSSNNQRININKPNVNYLDDTKIFSEKLPDRFDGIKDEVKNVISSQFDKLQCNIDKTYNTNDYINIVETLIYLKESIKYLIEARYSQHNIMNAYQQDVVHEIENIIVPDGDTSILDKLHIIREYRRYFEVDYRDLLALKSFIDSIDIETLNQLLNRLKFNKDIREKPIFKPLVDVDMINKYEWAKSIDNTSNKSNIDLTTYAVGKVNNTENESKNLKNRNKNVLKKFRVSCQVSGGGFGVFTKWYRDYLCMNSDIALAYATNTLNQLKETRNGMMWTDLDVVELDVKYNTGKVEIINKYINNLLDDMKKDKVNTINIATKDNTEKYLISCYIESKKEKIKGMWNKIFICNDLQQAQAFAQKELDKIKEYISDMYMTELEYTIID